ncbi:MAG: carboxylating nicotinate-nucleotide diphosphorylase [Deltaproteobacteria bacterium]|nr:carboxylating nicotinate-nucleotide diphosphorylase [Deltaproteobacteria bacterium]MBW2323922.1 carboxylating nicotinate-nucleotide diphosphorylase [Deltaproteobacteria bacterium]
MSYKHLNDIIRLALVEDIGVGDLTTALTVDHATSAQAEIVAKEDLVVAGLQAAQQTFELVDPAVIFKPLAVNSDRAASGDTLARLSGSAASILTAERVALNFLMNLSGVATLTARFVSAVKPHQVRIVDTRKTTPGMRALEKEAVRAGGGDNHRFGLFDGILIKDNHIVAAGSITSAVTRAKKGAPHTLKVEVEVGDLPGLEEAIAAGADIVLLDNMDPDLLTRAVKVTQGRVILEASGGINLTNVAQVAATGVDIISIGALTHSAPAVDISLDFTMGQKC